jgi:hypothetical protein
MCTTPFNVSFFDDTVIAPIERCNLLLHVSILDILGEEGDAIRPYLGDMTLTDVITLLFDHQYTLKVVPASAE